MRCWRAYVPNASVSVRLGAAGCVRATATTDALGRYTLAIPYVILSCCSYRCLPSVNTASPSGQPV